jgi:hypothetical protein
MIPLQIARLNVGIWSTGLVWHRRGLSESLELLVCVLLDWAAFMPISSRPNRVAFVIRLSKAPGQTSEGHYALQG